jgi:hypothetical protein
MEASQRSVPPLNVHPSTKHLLSIFGSYPFSLSRVSQPGQSRLRPSNEHCSIVRVSGAKGCPGCETVRSLPPQQDLFSLLLLFSPTRVGMEGGDLTCARRTRAFPGRAFREHRGPPSVLLLHYCHPDTSYPFSIKHRTTASAYGGSGSSGL